MIYILFNAETEETFQRPNIYFDNVYDKKWFSDPLVKRIIREIDSSEVVDDIVRGPLGNLTYERLSGTAKTLILALKADEYFEPDLIFVGDNGFQLFADISKIRDIYCVLTGDDFNMQGVEDFDFYCLNDKSYGHGWEDWINKMIEFCDDPGEYALGLASVKEAVDDR